MTSSPGPCATCGRVHDATWRPRHPFKPMAIAEAAACKLPPEGWWCSRPPGHDGPCAARPVSVVQEAGWHNGAVPIKLVSGGVSYAVTMSEAQYAAANQRFNLCACGRRATYQTVDGVSLCGDIACANRYCEA